MSKVVFIVGTPRSGTTLLQQLICQKYNVLSCPETHYFQILYYKNIFRSAFFKKKEKAFKALTLIDKEAIISRDVLNPDTFFELIKSKLIKESSQVFLEKTPIHLRHISRIREVATRNSFEVVFIHIVRDRYETVRSLYDVTKKNGYLWGGERSIKNCDKRWRLDSLEHFKKVKKELNYFIKYEDLVVSHEEIIGRIGRLLSLNLRLEGSEFSLFSVINSSEKWKVNNFKRVGSVSNYEFMSRDAFEGTHPLRPDEREKRKFIVENCL